MKRRPWAHNLAVWCCLLLLGSGLKAMSADGAELRLLCWMEYVPQTVIERFEQKTGTKVLLEHYQSNEQMLARLKARPGYYDLVQPSGFYVETLAKQGGL
jgi:spermidine/putrescine-binding protein